MLSMPNVKNIDANTVFELAAGGLAMRGDINGNLPRLLIHSGTTLRLLGDAQGSPSVSSATRAMRASTPTVSIYTRASSSTARS